MNTIAGRLLYRLEVALIVAALLVVASPVFGAPALLSKKAPVLSVYQVVHDGDSNTVPDLIGKTVTVVGYLTSSPQQTRDRAKNGLLAYLQDNTGGVALFGENAKVFANVTEADAVTVVGKISQYAGMEEIEVDSITVAKSPPLTVPKPRSVWTTDLIGEVYSGQLVQLEGEIIASRTNAEPVILLRDSHGEIPIHIPQSFLELKKGELSYALWKGGRVTITGIAAQSKATPPFDNGYMLAPRTVADIYFHPPPPPPPKPPSKAPLYISLVVAGVAVLFALYFFDRRRSAEKRAREVSKLLHAIQRSEAEVKKQAAFAHFNPNPVLEFFADGSLTYANDAAREMVEKLKKENIEEILPGGVDAIVRDCISSRTPRRGIEVKAAGRTVMWSFFPIHEITSVHAYGYDVTEQLSTEAQLRQAQKLESIGQLAAGVAHDFNNMLAVIQGYASLALMRSDLPDKIAEPLGEISTAAERASNLTRQLLTFSRHQAMEPRTLNLNDVVSDLTKMLRRLLGEDIKLNFNRDNREAWVHADAGMMEQVIVNLAVNARDAMPEGGELNIDLTEIDFATDQPLENVEARGGHFIRLTVRDTGCGMDDSTLKRIFEPFFTTKEVGKGTGLGLATVHGIVKQHKGWIEVISEVNKGTTFRIYLPVVEQPAAQNDSKVIRLPVAGGTETILLVEDDPAVRKLARGVLEEYGYGVIETGSAHEAMVAWKEHSSRIKLLFTDIVLPDGMSGWKLAEEIRAENPEIKVIYTTGFDLQSVNRRFSNVPNGLLLRKPYPVHALVRTVRECLDSVSPVQSMGTAQIS